MFRILALAAALLAALTIEAFAQTSTSGPGGTPGTASMASDLTGCIYTATPPVATDGQQIATRCDPAGNLKVVQNSPYPAGATPITSTSGNQANAQAIAALPSTPNKTNWITGFSVTGSGSTLGLSVLVTVTGLSGGATLYYGYASAVGVVVGNQPLIVNFPFPLPANGQNTAIVVTCPAIGLGSSTNAVNVQGYQL